MRLALLPGAACIFALALGCGYSAKKAQHDGVEREYFRRLQAQRAAITRIWRPTKPLLADEAKAYRCYVRFHLNKVESCDAELAKVEADLANRHKNELDDLLDVP